MFFRFYLSVFLPLFFSSFISAAHINSISTVPDTAHTDTSLYRMDEIVVTATRYDKKIIDIPYSVMRMDYKEYRFQKAIAVDEVLNGISGVFLQSRYGNHDVRISIRGFGSRSNSGIRGVRILLDNIPESEPDGQTRIEAIDFDAVSSIELVKGNSSSLYTNSPGGVINFRNDTDLSSSYALQFNYFGSFGLRRHGIKIGLQKPAHSFVLTYSRHAVDGFRPHSDDYWDVINSVWEIRADRYNRLQILSYFVNGQIRLPGSLTREEYLTDPWQAAQKEVDFDFKRFTRKGRLGLRFITFFDQDKNQELEIIGYGTIKYFERSTKIYRIINRYGLGLNLRYVNRRQILGRSNEFSAGGDLLYQTGPIETYQNINGQKTDHLEELTHEAMSNSGFFIQNSIDLFRQKFYLLLSARLEQIKFDQKNQLLSAQNDGRSFQGFTPKLAFSYKFYSWLALFSSWGISFDSPAANELDNYPISSKPEKLINPDLQPQKSNNFELGVKTEVNRLRGLPIQYFYFETSLFRYAIKDEIVPFEVSGDYYYRNSAQTIRYGLELNSEIKFPAILTFKWSYTYSDFTYQRYTARTVEVDQQGNLIIQDRDFSKNIVPNIPRHNFFFSTILERSILSWLSVVSQLNYWAVSAMYVNDANSESADGFQVIGVKVGMELSAKPFQIICSAGIHNLLDEQYVSFININSADQRFYEAGAPRNYFATLKINLNL